MIKEQLIAYKEKLAKLSEYEKKQRDIYLAALAKGEIQGPPVGYASIDKPWLKYYKDEQLNEDAPKMTCYENMYNNNKNHLDDIAIEYFGKKITYREFFENIDKAANAYTALGVKRGDIVTICSITTPEIMYTFYALNKIGAIANMIDVRYTKSAIQNYLNEVKSKVLVTLDLCYPLVKEIINETSVEHVVTISPTNSVPAPIKIGAKLASILKHQESIPQNDKYIDWNRFIKNGKEAKFVEFPYLEDYPAVIVHTGGTTGVPKGVLLTNDNFSNAVLQIKNSNVSAERGYRFLNIMPPFIAYGIVLGLHIPITLGWYTVVVPRFDVEKFDKLLVKHKPNGIMGVPTYWENVMKSPKMQNADMSYIKNILLGGDKIKAEFELKLDEFLRKHNCEAGVGKGYSMTEASACATFSSKKANELDSVGIPLTKTTISVFEPETMVELEYGKVGEICIKTPTMMKEYYEQEEATKNMKQEHCDGYWLHTGDLGYINENGIVFVKDRIKRMIIRSGFKVFPSEIENLFLSHHAVESCAVVGIHDDVDVNAPKAHIVLKEQYKMFEEGIKQELINMFKNSSLPPYFEPVDYKFRDSLPLTDIGKIDFISLQNEEEQQKQLKK